MNVSLTPELAKLVDEKVATGMYGSASEVIREALRLLDERDGELVAEGSMRFAVGEASALGAPLRH